MSTFEEVAMQRKWVSNFGIQRGEMYKVIDSLCGPHIDIDEVLSLTLGYLMEQWDEEADGKQITALLWSCARLAVRDVADGLRWEPREEGGVYRTGALGGDALPMNPRKRRERAASFGDAHNIAVDPWPAVDDGLVEAVDYAGDWRPWWMDRIDEEVDSLLPEGRGDAFRMQVEGLGPTEIGGLVGVDADRVENWCRRSGEMLSLRLRDVSEALGLDGRERGPLAPLTGGMIRLPPREGRRELTEREVRVGGFVHGDATDVGMAGHHLQGVLDELSD